MGRNSCTWALVEKSCQLPFFICGIFGGEIVWMRGALSRYLQFLLPRDWWPCTWACCSPKHLLIGPTVPHLGRGRGWVSASWRKRGTHKTAACTQATVNLHQRNKQWWGWNGGDFTNLKLQTALWPITCKKSVWKKNKWVWQELGPHKINRYWSRNQVITGCLMQKPCSFPNCISIHKSKGAKPHPELEGESQAFQHAAKQAPIPPKSVHRWPKEGAVLVYIWQQKFSRLNW